MSDRRYRVALSLSVGMTAFFVLMHFIVGYRSIVFPSSDFLPVHTALEIVTVSAFVSIFLVRWVTWRYTPDSLTLLIGMSFLGIALIQIVHALTYSGMPDFLGPNGVQLPTYFWMLARIMTAAVLLAAAFLPHDRALPWLKRTPLLIVVLVISASSIALVVHFRDSLPALVVVGGGLTDLKIGLEYVIMAVFAVSAVLYFRKYVATGATRFNCLTSALIISIFEEYAFTLYGSVYDSFSLLGHVLGAVASLVILRALFVADVIAPHESLLLATKQLKEAGETLEQKVTDRTSELMSVNEALRIEVAQRKKSEESLALANKKLAILGKVTRHDAANQLSSLIGFAELLKIDGGSAASRDYPDRIIGSAETIKAMMEFTKYYEELGSREPQWQPLRKVVSEGTEPFRSEPLRVETAIGTHEVYADPMLARVFHNLVDNALRHGGQVTSISIRSSVTDNGLVVTVEDDGVGVPLAEKEVIFEAGYGKHTGLGLNLAREILALTGIRIREVGLPGSGAKFEITFPSKVVR